MKPLIIHSTGWYATWTELTEWMRHPTMMGLIAAVLIVCCIMWLFTRSKGAVAIGISALLYLLPLLPWHDILRTAHI